MSARNPEPDTTVDAEAVLDSPTPDQRAVVAAHFEKQQREQQSAQRKALAARVKAEGRPTGAKPPMGCIRTVDKRGRKIDLPVDTKMRAVMQKVVKLRDNDKLSFREISDNIARSIAARDGKMVVSGAFSEWPEWRCKRAYHQEKAIQAAGW